jgi:hypothetical protein
MYELAQEETRQAAKDIEERLSIAEQKYQPSRQELLEGYNISIRFLSIGCIIEVGCKSIPFTNVEEALKELSEYVKNPYEIGEKWKRIFNAA